MRYLLLSSLLWVLGSCTNEYRRLQKTPGDPSCITKFKPPDSSQLYKARVSVVGKKLGGLLLVKTMKDSSTRVVFTAETGVKFFDFSFGAETGAFKPIYVMPKLNRKPVVEALRHDFELMLFLDLKPGEGFTAADETLLYHGFEAHKKIRYYVTDSACTQLRFAELASRKRKLVRMHWFGPDASGQDSIAIHHENFDFDITLKKLERL